MKNQTIVKTSKKKPSHKSRPSYQKKLELKKRDGNPIFINSGIENLSKVDQYFFKRFGQGPITEIRFRAIHKAFENQAMVNPMGIAIIHENQEITFQELDRQANALAHKLLQMNVRQGDNVGLFVRRSIPMVVGMLATLKIGAAYVPQHIGVARLEQLKHVVNTASIKTILVLSEYEHELEGIQCDQVIAVDRFIADEYKEDENIQLPIFAISPQDTCYIVYTSGTTGLPNGVQVTHQNLCNVLLAEPGNLWMRPGVKVAQILNIAFDMAAWETLGALSNGATLVIRGKNIQETVSKVDIVIATPTILSSFDIDKCKNIKVAAVAGEPCPRVLAEKWSNFCAFYNSCGPTEVTIVNTAQRFFPTDKVLSIGKPMPNNTVYILDENQQPCKIGEIGEMWAGGACVSKGYINSETLTNERYLDDPFLGTGKMFRTRDLGRWTPDGSLEHFGRTDDQVKISGFRVELDSITSIIEKMPEVKRAVTLKVDNKTLASFVSPQQVDTDKVTSSIENILPYYCVPKMVFPLEELPMTSRGKVDKRKLLKIAEDKLKEDSNEPGNNKGMKNKTPDAMVPSKITKTKPSEAAQPIDLDAVQLPPQQGKFRRAWKGETLMHYYRLVALVMLANIGILAYGYFADNWFDPTNVRWDLFSKIAIINFTVGILMRQQYVVNLLFALATSIPKSWPLSIRRKAGKIYHFGGVHIGGTVSGTFWFFLFVGAIHYNFFNRQDESTITMVLLATSVLLLALLVFIIVMALPKIRAKYHNQFEKSHRFGGWIALSLFWVQTISILKSQFPDQNLIETLSGSFSFWMLSLITFSILLPWLRLKKVKVELEKPSNHVVLAKFNYGETPFAGSSTAISRNPLMEWHSFANVPEPQKDGFKLTISRAGDWTGALIDDLPQHVWVKGITTAGVGNIDKLFNRVVWVATGSGIGPCLPHLLSGEVPSRLVWATRNPRKTYGDKLVDEILEAQPDAIIWDTDALGKPDMVKLSYLAYQQFDAEAIICISNKKLTWNVVYGMESRGIPAYGAIWDS
ncbi:AMP-binding protein [Aquimarina sp. ERC-38]|uniref:AMP-binding protein n=1 Tax=Aquimarina sp. ERC-38 TaxID=2949996 RepID=UPI002246B603|nr:AMP-binding protein [Aquimarina sp. ERC-38]UZO80898.1 AMP-binding protein [Aquimarina sp. ERC-38]